MQLIQVLPKCKTHRYLQRLCYLFIHKVLAPNVPNVHSERPVSRKPTILNISAITNRAVIHPPHPSYPHPYTTSIIPHPSYILLRPFIHHHPCINQCLELKTNVLAESEVGPTSTSYATALSPLFHKYSTLKRLQQSAAWWLRYRNILLQQITKNYDFLIIR